MAIVLAIVGLGLIIFVHEFGHFVAGKLMGLTVKEFKFGLPGPELIGFTLGETRYGITAIPFGGYVRFAGLESELSLGDEEEDVTIPESKNFDKQSIPRKAVIIAAGPMMNFAFAVVLFAAILSFQGRPVAAKPQVDSVAPGTPAASVGMRTGDTIVKVEKKTIKTWQDVLDEIKVRPNEKVAITVKRAERRLTFTPVLKENQEGQGFLGISPVVVFQRENPFVAIYEAILTTGATAILLIKTLAVFIATKAGALVEQSRGPVGIVQETAKVARQNIWDFVGVLAFLSINIGVVNLLPFPPLDGGRIALYGVEGVTRRKLSRKVVLGVSFLGLGLLLFFIIYVTIADVLRLLAGSGGF
ncbi:MAG: M50 family metallopeptidase [Candidatus Aquicultorales bacterium]